MKTNLVTRDSKGNIRVVYISLIEEDDGTYKIERQSGLLDGKLIQQPTLYIKKGKVKRTVKQQAELEYNSIIKKQLDKGYKDCNDLGITNLTVSSINTVLPKTKTDNKGMMKPMLCKVLDKTDKKLTDKNWIASYKIDGVRVLIYYKEGKVLTASRGGQDYNIPATYIRQDPYIISLFKEHPNLILDGEIYRHFWPLSKISGLCRKEELEEDHKELKLYCYDILDESKTFKERLKTLNAIRSSCPKDSRLVVIDQIPVSGLDNIMALHNKAVSEGYEGLVVRDPDATYKCGARNSNMMKIKEFSDDEFEITGIAEGLREEDMCFTLKTREGYPFKAKPMGTREDKQWYREHIDSLIGKFGTVKYFGFTKTECPVPNLPVLKSIRLEKDI